jgi:hypothetical protein
VLVVPWSIAAINFMVRPASWWRRTLQAFSPL